MDKSDGGIAAGPSIGITVALVCHADTPCLSVESLHTHINWHSLEQVELRFQMEGDATHWKIPPGNTGGRTDGLWQATCFELFIGSLRSPGYAEFNFSPSGQWAAYHFNGYREGMRELTMVSPPVITLEAANNSLALNVVLDLRHLPFTENGSLLRLGASAVVEQRNGSKSYWALAHPLGRPDFHHKDCFALQLPAPKAL